MKAEWRRVYSSHGNFSRKGVIYITYIITAIEFLGSFASIISLVLVSNLYSNSNLKTTDGYYLMYFTSPKEYTDINLFLDGAKLDLI